MSRSRNDFLEFMGSLSSCSSRASVKLYEERLKPGIENVRCPTTLQELADAAEKIINEKFAYDPRSTYTYRKDSEEISVELDQVIIAMLAYAEECGGEGGKRYVACAIMACSQGRRRGWSACGPRHNMAHPFFIHLSVILSYTKKSDIFLS